jgi:hypothetical protein
VQGDQKKVRKVLLHVAKGRLHDHFRDGAAMVTWEVGHFAPFSAGVGWREVW